MIGPTPLPYWTDWTQQTLTDALDSFVMDTKVGFGHQLLIVGLAYRHRAIPIDCSWVKQVRGHSSTRQQLALLKYVKGLIPKKVAVFLVGDSEFGSITVLRQLDHWRWWYVLRQKGCTCLWRHGDAGWQRLDSLVQEAGQSVWIQNAYLTKQAIYPVSIPVNWEDREKQPRCLATNLPNRTLTLR